MKLRLTKEFRFETSHALDQYQGLCQNLHGHSYRLFVTVIGEYEEEAENLYEILAEYRDRYPDKMVVTFVPMNEEVTHLITEEDTKFFFLWSETFCG